MPAFVRAHAACTVQRVNTRPSDAEPHPLARRASAAVQLLCARAFTPFPSRPARGARRCAYALSIPYRTRVARRRFRPPRAGARAQPPARPKPPSASASPSAARARSSPARSRSCRAASPPCAPRWRRGVRRSGPDSALDVPANRPTGGDRLTGLGDSRTGNGGLAYTSAAVSPFAGSPRPLARCRPSASQPADRRVSRQAPETASTGTGARVRSSRATDPKLPGGASSAPR